MIILADNITLDSDDPPLTYPCLAWHNLVTTTNLTTTATPQTNYPITNLANPSTALWWKSSAATDDIFLDLGGAEVDYIAFAGHNFASEGISVTVGSAMSPGTLIPPTTLDDDGVVIFRFPLQEIGGLSVSFSGGGIPQASVMYAGRLLVFERGLQGDYTPLPFGRVTNAVTGMSESGHFIGRVITGSRNDSQARFIGLAHTWMRENLAPFLAAATDIPFFFAWNPADYPEDTGFAWLTDDAQPVISLEGYVSITFNMTGVHSYPET